MAPAPEASKRMRETEKAPAPAARMTRQKTSAVTVTESLVHMNEETLLQPDKETMFHDPFSQELEHDVLTRDQELPIVVKTRDRRGAGLEKLTKTLGAKVAIQIPEGLKRPEQPLQAAKFASEGGYLARKHTPVLPHFKDYKKDATLMEDYVGKVAANFQMDTDSAVVERACKDMLQKISKNRRHDIKNKYFDPVPANEVSIRSPVPDMTDDE